jgi:hypothetical protein
MTSESSFQVKLSTIRRKPILLKLNAKIFQGTPASGSSYTQASTAVVVAIGYLILVGIRALLR